MKLGDGDDPGLATEVSRDAIITTGEEHSRGEVVVDPVREYLVSSSTPKSSAHLTSLS
jgi:hypothetical protein